MPNYIAGIFDGSVTVNIFTFVTTSYLENFTKSVHTVSVIIWLFGMSCIVALYVAQSLLRIFL